MAHNKNDIIYKTTVEDHTADLLRFFYPKAEGLFDFARGFEWLNVELPDIDPDTDNMKDHRTTDRVLKVYTLSGDKAFIIIDIEFQGYHDSNFNERMFMYYYRLFDKYGDCITLLVIYTDQAAIRSATDFNVSLFDTNMRFSFKPYRVWEQNEKALLLNNNPYAFVILTIMQGRKFNEEDRFIKATDLAYKIHKKQFTSNVKINLLRFIRLYFDFESKQVRLRFDAEINTLTNKINTMGIIEYEKMLDRQEGKMEGIREGERLGERLGRLNDARKMLQLGFSLEVISNITDLSITEIESL